MLRRIIIAAIVLMSVSSAYARQRFWSYCQKGGQKVVTQGLQSSGSFQRTLASCTLHVYQAGTVTLATLYSDNLSPTSTPLANPFTSASDGYFEFYAIGGRYDVQETYLDTTVTPNVTIQVTWADIQLCDPFGPNADSSCSGTSPSVETLNGIVFPNAFSGVNATAQQDAAISYIGAGPATMFDTVLLGTGQPTSQPNNVAILDFRQTYDFNTQQSTNADRVGQFFINTQTGDFSTRVLTGTTTFTNGSTAVTGTSTHFTTEVKGGGSGSLIKLAADTSTSWARVSTITDDAHLTLAAVYSGAGGVGSGLAAVTQFPLVINDSVIGGTVPDAGSGEVVGITSIIGRQNSGGNRGVYGANFNAFYKTPATSTTGQVIGLEIDLSNQSGMDDTTGVSTYGLDIISAGTNHPNAGIVVNGMTGNAAFRRGIFITPTAYTEAAIVASGASNMFRAIPLTSNSSPAIGVRNTIDSAYVGSINNDGSFGLQNGSATQLNISQTYTNPVAENIGILSMPFINATIGVNGNDLVGVYGEPEVSATNTQNLTDTTAALRGVVAQPVVQSGATGTITNAAGVITSFVNNGATTTNFFGVRCVAPTGTGTTSNSWCIKGETGSGIIESVDGFKTSANVTVSGIVKTGTASNTDLAGILTASGGTATYSFTGTYVSAPVCIVQDDTTIAGLLTKTVTNTTLTVTTSGATNKVSYICNARN